MSSFMIALLILWLIGINSLNGIFTKLFAIHYEGRKEYTTYVLTSLTGLGTALLSFGFHGFSYRPSLTTVGLGIAGALLLFGTYATMMRAIALGSYSFYCMSSSFGGTLIPILIAVLIYGESFQAFQIAGILLNLLSLFFFNYGGGKEANAAEKGNTFEYLFFCALNALLLGFYNQIISTQQILLNYQESSEMTITVYLGIAVLSGIGLLKESKKTGDSVWKLNRKTALLLAGCSVILPVYMQGVMLLFRHFSAALYYVIGSSGSLALSAIFAGIILREHFTAAKVAGVVLAAAGAVLMGF